MNNIKNITIYGATWCNDCNRVKQYLTDRKIYFDFINIDEVPGAADKVIEINKGLRSIPTIVFPDGDVLVEPSNEELKAAIDGKSSLVIAHNVDMKAGDKND